MLKNKELKKLQSEWYAKLKESGFHDIEQNDNNDAKPDGNLKQWHSQVFYYRHKEGVLEDRQEYYRLAGQFLYDHDFHNEIHKVVWACHSDGLSVTEIARKLNRDGLSRTSVFNIVKSLRQTMIKTHGIKQ